MDGCVLRSLFPKEVVECHFGLDAGGVGVAPDAIGGYERNVAVRLRSKGCRVERDAPWGTPARSFGLSPRFARPSLRSAGMS